MGWLSDALRFEVQHTKDIFKNIKKDPKRLVLGLDPLTTGFWNWALDRNDEPIVNQLGGATERDYESAEAKGINTGPGRTMHGVAGTVAGWYGGNAAGSALGSGAGGASDWAQYARLAQAAAGTPAAGTPASGPPPINKPTTAQSRPVIPSGAGAPQPVETGRNAQRRRLLSQALRMGRR